MAGVVRVPFRGFALIRAQVERGEDNLRRVIPIKETPEEKVERHMRDRVRKLQGEGADNNKNIVQRIHKLGLLLTDKKLTPQELCCLFWRVSLAVSHLPQPHRAKKDDAFQPLHQYLPTQQFLLSPAFETTTRYFYDRLDEPEFRNLTPLSHILGGLSYLTPPYYPTSIDPRHVGPSFINPPTIPLLSPRLSTVLNSTFTSTISIFKNRTSSPSTLSNLETSINSFVRVVESLSSLAPFNEDYVKLSLDSIVPLIQEISPFLVDSMAPYQLSSYALSLSKLSPTTPIDKNVFEKIEEKSLSLMPSFSPKQMESLAYSFVKLSIPTDKIDEAIKQRLATLYVQLENYQI